MEVFESGAYFRSFIPVQARSYALPEHAACACVAKQLGRAKGREGHYQWRSLTISEHGSV